MQRHPEPQVIPRGLPVIERVRVTHSRAGEVDIAALLGACGVNGSERERLLRLYLE